MKRYNLTHEQFRAVSALFSLAIGKLDGGSVASDPEVFRQVANTLLSSLDDDRIRLERLLYADEEMRGPITQLPQFERTLVADQVRMWKRLFPALADCGSPRALFSNQSLGQDALVVPNWEIVGQAQYGEAVHKMHQMLKAEHGITVKVESSVPLTRDHLRLRGELVGANNRLSTPDQLVGMRQFSVQFGSGYMRMSARRFWTLREKGECGFGPYEIAAMLLVHPELARQKPGFTFLCAGCEGKVGGTQDYSQCLHYHCNPDRKELMLVSRPPHTFCDTFVVPTAFSIQ